VNYSKNSPATEAVNRIFTELKCFVNTTWDMRYQICDFFLFCILTFYQNKKRNPLSKSNLDDPQKQNGNMSCIWSLNSKFVID
jgi:hypothetical protein